MITKPNIGITLPKYCFAIYDMYIYLTMHSQQNLIGVASK